MPFDIRCPKCGEPATVRDEAISKRAQCNRCRSQFMVRDAVVPAPPVGDAETVAVIPGATADTKSRPWCDQIPPPVTVCAIAAVVAIMTFRHVRSPAPGPSPASFTPSSPTFDPYQYNAATDERLKSLPSLSGRSDAEKEQIISAAKKFDAAVKARERTRGN